MNRDEIEPRTLPTENSSPGESARPQDQMPERLGRYRLLHRIGRGGMGTVFAAEDQSLGRRIAVRTMARRVAPRRDLVICESK